MCRLLILDDDNAFCSTLKRALSQPHQGITFEVTTTTDSEEAIRLVQSSVDNGLPILLFMIDDWLQGDQDGIAIWERLHRIVPEAAGIIYSGVLDPQRWSRALEVGIAHYLTKPLQTPELVKVLMRLNQAQQERRERDWLEKINDIHGETEKCQSFKEVARAIVKGALNLGFERARLFWFPRRLESGSSPSLVGICAAGQDFLPEFEDHIFKHTSSVYTQHANQTHEVLFFSGRSEGPGLMELEFGVERYRPPRGEWVLIPIYAEEKISGFLVLDNAEREMQVSKFYKFELDLFARMISAILGRARLFGLEKHRRQEIELINRIGRQVTQHTNDLKKLLTEIRIQIGQYLEVSNFIIALVDKDHQKLDFRLHYDNGKYVPRHLLPIDEGMTGYMVKERLNHSLFLAHGTGEFLVQHSIEAHGKPDQCWVGIPLWMGKSMIGVMILQHYTQMEFYDMDDVWLLEVIADQIAGAIFVALQTEAKQHRLEMLQRASADLMQLAKENERWMWKALLNIVSASYGLRFNCASIFMASKDNQRLIGQAGIGQLDREQAQRDWEQDLKDGMNYGKFLQYLRADRLRITPLESLTPKLTFTRGQPTAAFFQILDRGERVRMASRRARNQLPPDYVTTLQPSDCAIVPIKSGNKSLGLVIVDNRHDGKPILEEQLDHLETFLNLAGLAWESLRKGQQQEALSLASRAVTGQPGAGDLKNRLRQICQSTRLITDADWVVIYPFKSAGLSDEYDIDNIASDGDLVGEPKQYKDKPRQFGVSAYIVHNGRLEVEDVSAYRTPINGIQLADHPFIHRQGFHSFIGLPLTDLETAVTYGVMYLDFLRAQKFSEEDLSMANTLASLATNTIRTWYVQQKANRDLEEAHRLGQANQRELEITQNVLREALAGPDPRDIFKSLITAVGNLLANSDLLTWVAQKEKRPQTDGHLQDELYFYGMGAGELVKVEPPQDIEVSLVAQVLSTGQIPPDNGKDGYYLIPVHAEERCLGLLVVRNPAEPLTPAQVSALVRLASPAYLALDNIQRQQHLHNVLNAAEAITAPADLIVTLETIVYNAQNTFPGLDALTIWYIDPESGGVKVGPSFGVVGRNRMEQEVPKEGSIVWNVMHSAEPIFAEDTLSDPRLVKRFVFDENVLSTAALPLRSSGRDIGAIFFNYHDHRHFPAEERDLYEVFAAIASARLWDAYQLKQVKTILSLTEAIGTTLDLNQIIHITLQKLHDLLAGDEAMPCLLLYDQNKERLVFLPSSRDFYPIDNPEYIDRKYLYLSEKAVASEVAQRTLKEKRVISQYIKNIALEPGYIRMISQTRSVLSLSLVNRESALIGVLLLESPNPKTFEEMEVMLVEGIAREIALAIERRQLISHLRGRDAVVSKIAWASDLAHSINSTAGKIRQHADMLKEQANIPEAVGRTAETIDTLAARLINYGTGSERTRVEAVQLDQEVEAQVKLLLSEPHLQVRFAFEGGCPGLTIQADPLNLWRVLHHLVSNSLEEMQNRGEIMVRTSRLNDHWVEIMVEDSGPGFSESLRPLVFIEPLPTTKAEGSGYGLLYSRIAVEEMGGNIFLEDSLPGKGAVVKIHLRAEPLPAEEKK
jgi:GAF domain-containing protein/ActR/RegA family two-component response regulator